MRRLLQPRNLLGGRVVAVGTSSAGVTVPEFGREPAAAHECASAAKDSAVVESPRVVEQAEAGVLSS